MLAQIEPGVARAAAITPAKVNSGRDPTAQQCLPHYCGAAGNGSNPLLILPKIINTLDSIFAVSLRQTIVHELISLPGCRINID